jgi:hypothetical protein
MLTHSGRGRRKRHLVRLRKSSGGGKVLIMLPHAEGIQDIQVASSPSPELSARSEPLTNLSVTAINMMFTTYGLGFSGLGPEEVTRRALSAFLQKAPGLTGGGKLKHIPVKKFDGGFISAQRQRWVRLHHER